MNARGIARITVAIAVAIAVADGSVHGQQTARASVDAAGNESDGASDRQSISADGRWVVFQSIASNLVAGDANGFYDVFVRDLTTGTVERISVDSAGTEADGSSGVTSSRATSADGMVVAFSSLASNLVAGDVNLALDVFVRDRVAGTTEMVSVDRQGNPGDAQSFDGTVSADGRFVAFDSLASNLVTGDQNHVRDVFVRDRATGVTERVSVDSFGQEATADSLRPSLSLDGRYVAFMSFARDLDPNDFNSDADVFVRDRAAATTTRVSVDAGGNEADGFSVRPVISADGRVVAFESLAENLVSGDSNSSVDFFLHALVTGYTERISVDSNGHQSESSSENVSLSGDGRTAAFDSAAASLVASDDNGVDDVFVHTSAALPASWANYDAGFPGTYGVPTITARDLPIPGATLTVDVGNSYARPTWGVLLVGTARATIPTNRDGVILVDAGVVDPITFSYSSDSFTGTLPFDFSLIGTTLNLQALENDPGAAKGVSFTPGLELVLGW